MADRSVKVTLRAEIGQYKQAMAEASRATKGVGDEGVKASKAGREFVDSWAKAGQPLLAVGGAMTAMSVAVIKTGVAYNQLQQQSRAALTTMLGSAQAANAQMDKLDAFARTSPFSKQTFISAQQQMLAFGIEAEKVVPYLDAIQDAVASAGGSNHDLSELARIMSQIHASAKITATDLREFGNRGVDAATLIGDAMGKTGAQIREEITAGTLDADAALDALAQGMNARFDGAAENVKNTFMGALDRVSAAFRDFSSSMAEPFVGKEGGGLFVDLLNQMADFLRAVESLPGPVKASIGVVTALTGAATLAGGAFLVLAPRIVATRAALATLAADGSRAAIAIQHVGTAASKAGIALGSVLGVMTAVNAAFGALDRDSAATVEEMTGAILDLADGAGQLDVQLSNSRGLISTVKGVDEFTATIKEAHAGTEGFTAAMSKVFSFGGMFGSLNPYGDALEDVKAYDEALSSLVASGATEKAAAGYEKFADAAKDAGLNADQIAKLLPGYTAALKDADNQQRLAGDSATDAASGVRELSEAAQKSIEAATKAAEGWIDYGAALKEADGSLQGWLDSLNKQAKALENFNTNSVKALGRGLREDVVQTLREMGPEGAKIMAELANASEKEIERANKTFGRLAGAVDGSTQAVAELKAFVEGLPGSKKVVINVNTGQALKLIQDVRTAVDRLTGKTITIGIRTVGSPGTSTANADGGLYTGSRWKAYADGGIDEYGRPVQRYPQIRSGSQGTVVWGEPETGWEAYISGKPGKKERNRAIATEAVKRLGGDVQWFADGGFTEAMTRRELLELRIRIRDMRRELLATEKVGKGKSKRKRWVVRGLDRQALRMDLFEAQRELQEQQRIRRRIGPGKEFRSVGAYNRAMERREEAREQREQAREERRGTAASFADGLGADAFRSPASLERHLSRMLRESAEFTALVADLRKAGASPWLLQQILQVGPSRATNRTLRQLLGDSAKLARLNAMSAGMVTVGNNYAALVSGKGFDVQWSGQASYSASQVAAAGRVSLDSRTLVALGRITAAAARDVSVRAVDYREYSNGGAARFPSPVPGVVLL